MDREMYDSDYDQTHDFLDRREFFKRLSALAGGTALIPLLTVVGSETAKAQVISKDDPRLSTEDMKYSGATGEVSAYLAKPKQDGKVPGVIVIHENRGLVPHIKDVARRVALEGFLAMAPDALTPLGGTPEEQDKAVSLIQKLDGKSTIENYIAAVKYLKTQPSSTGKVGVVGFCWGGAMANQIAVNSPDVTAVVSYYGRQPAPEDVPKIRASLLLHYAGLDEGINKGIPGYEEALKKASVNYKIYMYDGAQHAFNNDANPARYNREAAQLAWQRTISFFKEKLKT